ncbi:MAG: Hsp33 family molecular chaperone HslO [Ignavibacteria bacterium]|nr:Hsp33 family molecular chaperone HslO [Ignavibacteria bacterium]
MDDLKRKYQLRDRVIRAITTNGKFRVAAVKSTATSRMAMENHQLNSLSGFLLSRALSGVALLSSFLKGEERISIQFDGNGPVRTVYAEALQVGEIRGYVRASSEIPEINSLADGIGIGFLKVSKYLYDNFEPVMGIVDLQRSDITTDIAYYLAQSEQIPSGITLDVLFSENDEISEAGGVLVQAMPGATEQEIEQIEEALTNLPPIGNLLADGISLEDILARAVPFEFDVVNNSPIDFFCRCSMDKFKDLLLSLGVNEIRDMKNSGQNELVCQYCSKKYLLEPIDFEEIITTLKARAN